MPYYPPSIVPSVGGGPASITLTKPGTMTSLSTATNGAIDTSNFPIFEGAKMTWVPMYVPYDLPIVALGAFLSKTPTGTGNLKFGVYSVLANGFPGNLLYGGQTAVSYNTGTTGPAPIKDTTVIATLTPGMYYAGVWSSVSLTVYGAPAGAARVLSYGVGGQISTFLTSAGSYSASPLPATAPAVASYTFDVNLRTPLPYVFF